ncbi:sigma-54-dependent transcriptional regulator [Halocynthiibacter styelae]|uniref:Nif-specific regulatory protein n=1 Tax=Halocynthiibacter styelae TaxID=2761955 RepID=A0A8J7IDD3_9RHOB|nr:sigma-54 dependent transcriptional regulator [Paenihalocynthiibacter styelae]MBI1492537.1 sigma-54-dependent Fis family transcriptional regulator [Paenihalocynthiibacter styelae]
MTTQLLLIDGTSSLPPTYQSSLNEAGYRIRICRSGAEGLIAFQELRPQVVLLDLVLPDRDDLEVLQEILTISPDTRVIVITATGSIDRAVDAMRAGAHEFLLKPFNEQRFLAAIRNASRSESNTPIQSLAAIPPLKTMGFIGSSAVMEKVYDNIRTVAGSMATVFITGESGTGKEICAQALHDLSNRSEGPFIPLNCGAIPNDLLESEIFGHLRGAFTGAISDKPGAAAMADGGTLFFDEICEMSMELQTKLLRFLQTSMIQPVGSVRPVKVNVRIVCATNLDPLEQMRLGKFREDLYYRLHVVPLHLPPLRERGDDIMEIAKNALQRFSAEENRLFEDFSDEVDAFFNEHHWPGNVRQLLNVMRNIVVLNNDSTVTMDMLPHDFQRAGQRSLQPVQLPSAPPTPRAEPEQAGPALDDLIGKSLDEIERIIVEETIARNSGSIPVAARVLAVSPSTLYRKISGWKQADKQNRNREKS